MIGPSRAVGAERRVTWVTCVVLVVLHLVLAGHVSVLGATPDFLLVLTACLSFMKGSRDGAIADSSAAWCLTSRARGRSACPAFWAASPGS